MKRYLIFLSTLLGLSVGCHAASPSFGSFNQTYFTTNNLFISIRTNWISTNSITTLIVTNLYVTNLYSTNIIVNGTNVATFGDLIWTNDTSFIVAGRVTIKPEISYAYVYPSNLYSAGLRGIEPQALVPGVGTHAVNSTEFSHWVILSTTNDASQVIITLDQGAQYGQELWLTSLTNSPWDGRFTLVADSAVSGSGGLVKLNNDQDWLGENGAVIKLLWAHPDWWEVGRWNAGSTNQPQSVVMNPTDNYLPVRQSAGVFADSPLHIPSAGDTNVIANGSLYVGQNSLSLYGDTDLGLIQYRSVQNGDADLGGIAIWTQMTNSQGIGFFDVAVRTNEAIASVSWNNGSASGRSVALTANQDDTQISVSDLNGVVRTLFQASETSLTSASMANYVDTDNTWTQGYLFGVKNNGTNLFTVGITNNSGATRYGPGDTNVVYKDGLNLIYESSPVVGNPVAIGARRGASTAYFGVNSAGGAFVQSAANRAILDVGGVQAYWDGTNFLPDTTNKNLGTAANPWSKVFVAAGGGSGVFIQAGTGDPTGVVTANVGSLWLRTDGGAGSTLYVKESATDATGWVAK